MKKGFTLIELLAVIVILAIISLIAIPVVLNMIENTRKGAAESSAYGYVDAVNNVNILADTDDNYEMIEGVDIDISTVSVDIKGSKPTSGRVTVSDGAVVNATLCINGYEVEYKNSIAKVVSKCNSKNTLKAAEVVTKMGMGINIGNSFDSISSNMSNPLEAETYWHNPVITKAYVKKLHQLGFKTVRLPVTYYNHLENNVIDPLWLDRVAEVVNYALDYDMYVIIDIHHDASLDRHAWIAADPNTYATDSVNFINLWTQIANRFKNYSYKLMFEGFNEIVDSEKNRDNSAAYPVVHDFNQIFIDTVRATGGKNADRFLILSTYCGSISSSKVPPSLEGGFNDPAEDKLLVAMHSYSNDVSEIGNYIKNRLTSYKETYGIPIILDEFGTKADEVDLSTRIAVAQAYVNLSKNYSIPLVWWDNGKPNEYELIDRATGEIIYPDIVNALLDK